MGISARLSELKGIVLDQIALGAHLLRKKEGDPQQRALQWLHRMSHPTGGVRVHNRHRRAYPEVTGYLIPTLIDYSHVDLALQWADWLTEIQLQDGSFPDPDGGRPCIFDTGQALRGLLAAARLDAKFLQPAAQAGEYLVSSMIDGGRSGMAPQCTDFGIQETIQLYTLPPLIQLAEVIEREHFAVAADRCRDFYLQHPQFLKTVHLTHFLAYELEALIDLGLADVAAPVLHELADQQRDDGSVRAKPEVGWTCTPGVAQLAVCWYKTGALHSAEAAYEWLKTTQRATGGFLGSVGRKAAYFPHVEPAWCVKYFLDAARLHLATQVSGEQVA